MVVKGKILVISWLHMIYVLTICAPYYGSFLVYYRSYLYTSSQKVCYFVNFYIEQLRETLGKNRESSRNFYEKLTGFSKAPFMRARFIHTAYTVLHSLNYLVTTTLTHSVPRLDLLILTKIE